MKRLRSRCVEAFHGPITLGNDLWCVALNTTRLTRHMCVHANARVEDTHMQIHTRTLEMPMHSRHPPHTHTVTHRYTCTHKHLLTHKNTLIQRPTHTHTDTHRQTEAKWSLLWCGFVPRGSAVLTISQPPSVVAEETHSVWWGFRNIQNILEYFHPLIW